MKDILKGITYIGIFAVPGVVLLVIDSMFFPYITGKNFTFRILVEIITVSWALLALYDARYRPQFSWIVVSLLGFLGVMLVANAVGEYPLKSFWSNYERMEGYVTLVHFFLYFLVVGSMLRVEKHWNWFFNTSLAIAAIVCFYAFAQLSGMAEISQGGTWRVDSTLGNSTYMAVYMLFHIFIAALMFTRTTVRNRKIAYGLLIALFTFMLFQTGTRGAALGLVGGGLLTALYLTVFATGYPRVQKAGAGILVGLVLLVGGFIAVRHTAFVQSVPMLDRLADITLAEGSVRFMVWGTAWEGFKERPILGWGQENFSYVFNKHYNPELHRAEAWYDRTHNVVLDWLIAGGVLGLLAYVSIFAAALYYILVRPLGALIRKKEDDALPIVERALLFGLLGAYVFHNLFVFDNVVSYIFFAVVLAYLHSRTAVEWKSMQKFRFDEMVLDKVVVPAAGVALVLVIYFVNVPAMLAAGDIINALRVVNPYTPPTTAMIEAQLASFESALDRSSFGRQEIVEQISDRTMAVIEYEGIPAATKSQYAAFAEAELMSMIEEKPNDPRFPLFLAGMYRATGQLEKAAAALREARASSPTKPTFVVEQGIIEFMQEDYDVMAAFFKEAYELAPSYGRARILYTGSLLYTGETGSLPEVLTEAHMLAFADNSAPFLAIGTEAGMLGLTAYFDAYLDEYPESVAARTAYAQILQLVGEEARAIALIEAGAARDPRYGALATCFIENIEAKRAMRQTCE